MALATILARKSIKRHAHRQRIRPEDRTPLSVLPALLSKGKLSRLRPERFDRSAKNAWQG